ncbi:MAG: dihydroorotase, partial [Planctomycetota bacterium]|nr:dihydroorotase [Planctomycetota bacterium]
MSRLLVKNARIPGGGETSLAVEDGKITGAGPGVSGGPGAVELDAEGLWAVPGWIDLQVNDIG